MQSEYLQKLSVYLSTQNTVINHLKTNQTEISNCTKFNVGQSNPTYLIEFKNTPVKVVLRRKPDGKLLPGAHLVEREYLITSKLAAVGFPVAKPILLCEDTSIVGTTFYLMEFVEGRIFKDSKFSGVSTSERRELILEHVRTLAKLHSIDITKLDLSTFGKADKFYERQINTWTRQYKFAETDRNEWMEQLIEWLPKNIKDNNDDSVCICHGDFAINNVIFHPTQPKIIAVIDWELSTIGRSFADLGYILQPYYMSPYPIESHPGGYKGFTHLLDIPSIDEVVGQYVSIRGLAKPDLRFQIAFSMFRLASITQGVYKRALQGNASQKEQGLQMFKLSKFLSKDAWDVVKLINPDPFSISALIENDQPRWGQWPISERCKYYYYQVKKLLLEEIIPLEKEMLHLAESRTGDQKWKPLPQLQQLKQKAKSLGLFNLFCTYPTFGRGLTNLEYAFICELMGMSPFAPEVFNCSAPDTGNMEVLILYGNRAQQMKYLIPLLEGEIRSCFAMTEPAVASSDATNIQTSIQKNENGYLINGKKWYISGAGDERCKVAIVMGKTDTSAKTHQQQSMILVDLPHPNVQITRPMHVFGYDEAPHGHMEMVFNNAQVPAENLLLREGAGFEIAQGRLGGGRLHHCMRLIGICHRVLDLMIQRGESRIVFKKKLGSNDSFQQKLGELETLLSSARLMVFNAAMQLDLLGNKRSFTLKALSECKVYVPKIAQQIIDEAIQVFGAEGVSQDQILTQAFIAARTLRIADGPDAVHYRQVARFATYNSSKSDFTHGKGYGLAKL